MVYLVSASGRSIYRCLIMKKNGDMGFTLSDFERYIASLRERRPLG